MKLLPPVQVNTSTSGHAGIGGSLHVPWRLTQYFLSGRVIAGSKLARCVVLQLVRRPRVYPPHTGSTGRRRRRSTGISPPLTQGEALQNQQRVFQQNSGRCKHLPHVARGPHTKRDASVGSRRLGRYRRGVPLAQRAAVTKPARAQARSHEKRRQDCDTSLFIVPDALECRPSVAPATTYAVAKGKQKERKEKKERARLRLKVPLQNNAETRPMSAHVRARILLSRSFRATRCAYARHFPGGDQQIMRLQSSKGLPGADNESTSR